MSNHTVCLAMHYQNEVLHGQGKIKVGVAAGDPKREAIVAAAKKLLDGARAKGVPVVSVRIAFRPDHADVIQNCPIFRAVAKSGAMAEGSWGAEFHEGLGPLPHEFVVKHSRINGFYGSPLEQVLHQLGARRLIVAGIATNSTVEHTVRHGRLPKTTGFFFGESDGSELEDDLDFIAKAREALAADKFVYYTSWW